MVILFSVFLFLLFVVVFSFLLLVGDSPSPSHHHLTRFESNRKSSHRSWCSSETEKSSSDRLLKVNYMMENSSSQAIHNFKLVFLLPLTTCVVRSGGSGSDSALLDYFMLRGLLRFVIAGDDADRWET